MKLYRRLKLKVSLMSYFTKQSIIAALIGIAIIVTDLLVLYYFFDISWVWFWLL